MTLYVLCSGSNVVVIIVTQSSVSGGRSLTSSSRAIDPVAHSRLSVVSFACENVNDIVMPSRHLDLTSSQRSVSRYRIAVFSDFRCESVSRSLRDY